MATYVPRVFVCGDVETFRKKIGDNPVEVIGRVENNLSVEEIERLLDETAEYLIFTDDADLYYYLYPFKHDYRIMSLETFAKKNYGKFFPCKVLAMLQVLLDDAKNFSKVLDFDCMIGASDFRTKIFTPQFDCLAENIYPIYENVYEKIYRSFDECKFHHFDALILSKERSPEEFIDVLIETDALTEKIFVFVRKNSELEKFLATNKNIFAEVQNFKTENGAWFFLKKFSPPEDVGVYVVTHKDAKLSALPAGYKFIHAGKALAKKDFGYIGDDTGDNISELNPFLDEVTALYWIWKNTSHTHTGFVHYRRFFTSADPKIFDVGKILSAEEILSLLREYDIVVNDESLTDRTQIEMMIYSTGQAALVRVCEKIIRKHLTRTHPDYLDAFDDVLNGVTLFPYAIHVTRRNIFNAYCEWLFSFLIDATLEIRDKLQIGSKSLGEMEHDYSRVAGYFAERMLTIWLTKNHLQIKTLPMMFREDV